LFERTNWATSNDFKIMTDRFAHAPISELMGFHVLSGTAEDHQAGRAVVELNVDSRLNNPMGKVHGGVLALLSDCAMGIAFGRTLEPNQDFSTIDLHIHFMRPVRGKLITATGTLIQRGLRVGYVECNIVDDGGRLIARSSCSCTVI
jgi:uncharacterized protein (TIGR00369 family)